MPRFTGREGTRVRLDSPYGVLTVWNTDRQPQEEPVVLRIPNGAEGTIHSTELGTRVAFAEHGIHTVPEHWLGEVCPHGRDVVMPSPYERPSACRCCGAGREAGCPCPDAAKRGAVGGGRVVTVAENGRPKIVELHGARWVTGVMGGRLIINHPLGGRAIEVEPEVRITAAEWHRVGLTAAQLRAAVAFARTQEPT